MIPNPTKATVLACSVAGADFTRQVLKISVFESVCKAYLTGVLVVRDDSNLINALDLQGQEPVSFLFSGGDGLNYSQTMHVLRVKGEPMENNLRTVKYTIDLIGKEYYNDRANMVQQSFQNLPGTQIIQQIQSSFLGSSINIPLHSAGIFGQKNPYVVSSTKPFKAINDIRKMLSFSGPTSATMYYRDKDGVNLSNLAHMFSTMGSQYSFEQKTTWGADWRNVLGAYNSILAATTLVDQDQGRSSGRLTSATDQFERKVRDLFSTKKPFSDAISAASGAISSVTGGHGGLQHFPVIDSTILQKENIPNTGQDASYSAKVAGGPQVIVKVPLQTGVLCTVGKGVTVSLISPSGDYYASFLADRNSGNKLVADLCHTVETGEQGMQGTSTMRLVTPPGH